jgi:hypothetical protein
MNGNGKNIVWWVLGGLLAPLLVAAVTHLYTACSQHGERISILESRQNDVSRRLDHIEEKLDKLLQRRP